MLAKAYHLTDNELAKAINGGYLSRVKRGYYRIEEKLKIEFLLSNLLNKINTKDFEGALIVLDLLWELQSGQQNDYNCYLFLLGQIIELPKQYRGYVDKMTLNDIKNPRKNEYGYVSGQIYSLNIGTACMIFNNNILSKGSFTMHDQIMRSLLDLAYKEIRRFENEIKKYLIEENYWKLKQILERRRKSHKISCSKEELLILVKLLEAIKRFRVVPSTIESKSGSSYDMILSGNFTLMKEIMKRTDNTTMVDYENRSLPQNKDYPRLRLLDSVVASIDELKSDAYKNGEIILTCPVELIVAFTDIVDLIMDCKRQEGYDYLYAYLEEKNKEKYFDIISSLFSLSIHDEDYTFYSPLKGLVLIASRNPSLKAFYKNLYDKPDRTKKYAIIPTRKYIKRK